MFAILLAFILLVLFVFGAPYALHFDSVRLTKPVVVFRYRWWRQIGTLTFAGGLAAGWFTFAIWLALATGSVIFASILLLLLLLLSRPFLRNVFITFQLHLSYWQQERAATLTFLRPEQRAVYRNKNLLLSFSLSEISGITTHQADTIGTRRAPVWSSYYYQIWTLQSGKEFIVTCFLFDFIEPATLLPAGWRKTRNSQPCWLPDAEQKLPNLLS